MARGSGQRSPSTCSRTGKPGTADVFHQRVKVIQARLGREFEVIAIAAESPEEAPHLGQRDTACLLHTPQGIPVLLHGLRQPVPDSSDLKHHHAHGVGDDVVQLARDPRALLSDCDAGRRVALALGVRGAFFRRLGLHHPLAQRNRQARRSRTGRG